MRWRGPPTIVEIVQWHLSRPMCLGTEEHKNRRKCFINVTVVCYTTSDNSIRELITFVWAADFSGNNNISAVYGSGFRGVLKFRNKRQIIVPSGTFWACMLIREGPEYCVGGSNFFRTFDRIVRAQNCASVLMVCPPHWDSVMTVFRLQSVELWFCCCKWIARLPAEADK